MKNQIYNLSDSAVVNISNSSEGNQLKWKRNNYWFKADIKGYCYNAKARPFSRSFKTQTMAVRKYYDVKYNMDNLSYEKLYEGLEDYYTKDEIFRAIKILQFQVNRLQERSID